MAYKLVNILRLQNNIITPAFMISVTCTSDIFLPSLDIPFFDMLCKWLKYGLPVKLPIFLVISRTNDKNMMITDLK